MRGILVILVIKCSMVMVCLFIRKILGIVVLVVDFIRDNFRIIVNMGMGLSILMGMFILVNL
jgi:hypothetical protein